MALHIEGSDIVLRAARHAEALAALRAILPDDHRWWLDEAEGTAATLAAFLEAWGFDVATHGPAADIVGVWYRTGWQADSRASLLWETLAPFMEDGSTVDYEDDDGHRWRLYFAGGALHELEQLAAYEPPPGVTSLRDAARAVVAAFEEAYPGGNLEAARVGAVAVVARAINDLGRALAFEEGA